MKINKKKKNYMDYDMENKRYKLALKVTIINVKAYVKKGTEKKSTCGN